jgi:threonylcarbamoyladenosine tRNA methylthiotransferase MtaB
MPYKKTFKLVTLGCKVNQYESDVIRAVCLQAGYAPASKGGRADLVVVNTCAVTAVAVGKSRRAARKALRMNPDARLVVTGCAVEAEPATFDGKGRGVTLLAQSRKAEFPALLGLDAAKKMMPASGRTRAFLKIQDGCDHFCSYCIVPRLRRTLWSKPLDEVLAEAEYLAARGHREIVLTGVRLGLYDGGVGLPDLVNNIEEHPRPERIRLSSLEPWEVTDELIAAAAASKKFCRHLHVPMQSGDDEILRRMNRPYTSAQFLERLDVVRRALPGVAITTDVIVGFPGETEEAFQNTLSACRKAGFSKIHIFPFSPREGTEAAGFAGMLKPEAMRNRVEALRNLEEQLAIRYKMSLVGKAVEVLVEKGREKESGLAHGTSREYVKTFLCGGRPDVNSIVNARVLNAHADRVEAEIVNHTKSVLHRPASAAAPGVKASQEKQCQSRKKSGRRLPNRDASS